jgi:hypothetical protein
LRFILHLSYLSACFLLLALGFRFLALGFLVAPALSLKSLLLGLRFTLPTVLLCTRLRLRRYFLLLALGFRLLAPALSLKSPLLNPLICRLRVSGV